MAIGFRFIVTSILGRLVAIAHIIVVVTANGLILDMPTMIIISTTAMIIVAGVPYCLFLRLVVAIRLRLRLRLAHRIFSLIVLLVLITIMIGGCFLLLIFCALLSIFHLLLIVALAILTLLLSGLLR